MKKIILLLITCIAITGCDNQNSEPTADDIIQKKQAKAMREAQRQTGLPSIKNYQEKKMLKMLYELRDQENLVCHAYLFNSIKGEIGQYIGECMGYGLSASTQYSNPEKIVTNYTGHQTSNFGKLPQAEPNGLFMPQSSSATWLMIIDPRDNEPRPVYIEPLIIVSPFPLH